MNWLSWQIVSDDKIQIRKLILRRGALSTSAGLYHPIDLQLTAIPKTWTNAVHYKFRRRRSSWKVLSFTWLLLCSQIVRTKGEKARNLDSTSLKGQVLTTRFITKIISALFPSNLNDIPHLFATIITALLQKNWTRAQLLQLMLGAHCWLLIGSNLCFMRGRVKLMSHNITSSKDREPAK